MIRGFKDRDAQALYEGKRVRRFDGIRRQAEKRLRLLDAVTSLHALSQFRGARLEALKGDRKGQYSMRINDQWRLCFTWADGAPGPSGVEIVDYH